MKDAPETIWTCTHVGEYGYFYPTEDEAKEEYGGTPVRYRRADLPPTLDAVKAMPEVVTMLAEMRKLKLLAWGYDYNFETPFHAQVYETVRDILDFFGGSSVPAALAPFTGGRNEHA